MTDLLGISRTGMHAHQYQMDTVANDIANVNTTGYKNRKAQFEELLANNYDDNGSLLLSDNVEQVLIQSGSKSNDYIISYDQGSLLESASPYQFAISGEGFFQITTAEGETYFTRDGDFGSDSSGTQVVNARGERVTMAGEVPMVFEPAGGEMLAVGENKYAPQGAMMVSDSEVISGYLEQSNVDLAASFTDMIVAQRAYAMNVKAMQSTDEMMSLINQFKQ